MKNIVGQIASQEDFYERKREIARIKRQLEAGANIQLTAPRRVGKSSILYYLKDNPTVGYHFLYLDVESARTQNDFYRKIYEKILKDEILTTGKRFWEQIKSGGSKFLNRLKGIKLGITTGIDFNEEIEINYEEELINLLIGIDLNGDKLVIMIDEFPEVILNIVEDNKGDTIEAIKFLQSNRALRNNPDLHKKVQFIYTGSNSLNVTVADLNDPKLINDVPSVPVNPLTIEESKDFIRNVLTTYHYRIDNDELDYFINKVEWLIPFYFQLMIQEIIDENEPDDVISKDFIDIAFNKIFKQRNDHHFEHYVKRLKRVFKGEQSKFVKIFLNKLAQNPFITKDEAINLAHGIVSEEATKRVIQTLEYDGYIIIINEDQIRYKFNSPILKMWWLNHEC
jgi:uncharacterized protein